MKSLSGVFSRLSQKRILVVGDLMLDSYTIGKAHRISPEAPVAVVKVHKEEQRPGGAGNVALNLVSLGAEVSLVGRIGSDVNGQLLSSTLADEGIGVGGIVEQPHYETPVKNRIIADNQQIVRVDHEEISTLPEVIEQQLIDSLSALLEGVDLIAVSDYGKGFLSQTLLSALIEVAKVKEIPVVVDPKGVDFSIYRGADVVKPNVGEAYAAANVSLEGPIDQAAEKLLEITEANYVVITRSEAGISIFDNKGGSVDFPTRVREVKDVTGAGDTVLAALSYGLANGLSIQESVQLSNFAAGIAISHFGCARVTLSDLAHRMLREDVANKVFDEEHLFALQEALKGRSYVVLGVSGTSGLTSEMFQAIRSLSQADRDLMIYVMDDKQDEGFIQILSSLHEVDFILLKKDRLHQLSQWIGPEGYFCVDEDGALKGVDDFNERSESLS